jgi:hypothetical protein
VRATHRTQDIALEGISCEGVDSDQLAQDKALWRALENKVKNFRFYKGRGIYLLHEPLQAFHKINQLHNYNLSMADQKDLISTANVIRYMQGSVV